MIPAWIIKETKKKQKEENTEENQPRVYIPLPISGTLTQFVQSNGSLTREL